MLQTIKPQRFDDSMLEVDQEKQLVNLTAIAKRSGKRVPDRLALEGTKQLIEAYKAVTPITVLTRNGGSQSGTRATKDLALEMMQWISPQLKIYCLGKLNELFTTGSASLQPKLPVTAKQLSIAYAQLAEKEEQIEQLALEAIMKDTKIEEIQERLHTIESNNTLFTTTDIAKTIGGRMTATKLNQILVLMKIVYKRGDKILLCKAHEGRGLEEYTNWTDPGGKVRYTMKRTQTGRERLLLKKDIIIDGYNQLIQQQKALTK